VAKKQPTIMDKLVSLTKRRGFIFQSSEIYGGINSCYDYGPLGVELKKNIKELWWKSMVYERADIEGIDASILMHPRVWEASGHVEGFTDPLVDCKNCKMRWRADQIDLEKGCPNCGGELTEPRMFNLMFKTFMGPVEDDAHVVYLRPETAQGIYVNFHNVRESMRKKIPFGIAQIGKAFRNEITPMRSGSNTGKKNATNGTIGWGLIKTNSAFISTAPMSWPITPKLPLILNMNFPLAGAKSKGFTTAPILTSPGIRNTPARTCAITTRKRMKSTSHMWWKRPRVWTA